MKVKMGVSGEMPGGFVIEAETPEECMLIRIFANWPNISQEKFTLFIGNHGGNISENKQSMFIHWRKLEE